MDSTHTTTRDIRRRNRSVLLTTLFKDGPLSRLELSQVTGLSTATVSTVTADLLADGLVAEAGQVESAGGRPRVLLRLNPEYGYLIGVDVGETGVTVELFDAALTRLRAIERPLDSVRPEPKAVVKEVASAIADILAGPPVEETESDGLGPVDPALVIGIGIGVPGIVEEAGTALVHAPTIGWHSVALAELLSEAGVTPPVLLGNGARTQAQAEMWFGAAKGVRHAVIALVGSGVGATVVTEGSPYRGMSGSAGEWGHTTLVYGGRGCRCGATGCVEAYVGAEGVLARLAEATGEPADDDEVAGLARLIAAADAAPEGPEARLLDAVADELGAAIGNLVNILNPERVVLGGWAGLAMGAARLPRIRFGARRQALDRPYHQVSIELSHLGPDAVALGAATLPLAALLARGGEAPRMAPGRPG
ncbi:ROK family transcriptional regulator [Luedemannella flava]|uniref:ROK family transcriptional regulator n=1 Tax=Luedemannella flava TaxID=349316 RepID=A0ABN2LRU1_9ACTN